MLVLTWFLSTPHPGVVAAVRGGWARGWRLFSQRRNGVRVCEVRARRFRLSVSASSRAPHPGPLTARCPICLCPFSTAPTSPAAPPSRKGLGVAAFNYANIVPSSICAYVACPLHPRGSGASLLARGSPYRRSLYLPVPTRYFLLPYLLISASATLIISPVLL